jgi:hypothetical protein
MESWDYWDDFLLKTSAEHKLTPEAEQNAFIVTFARRNLRKSIEELASLIEVKRKTKEEGDPVSAYKKRMGRVYKKFEKDCPALVQDAPDKRDKLLPLLKVKYSNWLLETRATDSSPAGTTALIASEPGWGSRFQGLIEDKTKEFVGRQYVFKEIANFLVKHPKGYFIIEGDPGIGKSAILAEYVRLTGCVVHFNVQGQYETAEEFLKTLCTELLNRYQLTSKTLPTDSKQYGSFLSQLLAETAKNRNGKQVVIAIDALDEVDISTHNSNNNILSLPRYLSEGIYFVMTRRRGVEIPFITDAPQQLFKLMDYENQSREDVRTYIQNRVNGSELLRQQIVERGETEAEFIEKIAEKSENNFMYLVNVLKDIEKGFYKDLSLERFPQGLQQYYEFHWRRMEMTVKPLPVTKINIVYHLAESHQPISCQLISEYVGEQQLTVQELLDDWEQFLHKPIIEGETCYSIYHASFRDFLHRKDIVQAAGVSLKAINKQKSDNLWEAMFGDE